MPCQTWVKVHCMAPSMRTTQHSHCNTLYAYSVDSVLGGAQGLLRGEVTELIGPSASGKTQVIIMHTSHCSHSIVAKVRRLKVKGNE